MAEQWLTYRQLGELWNTTPEAARARSRRGNYQRRTNEQGTAEVLVDLDDFAIDSSQREPGETTWNLPVLYGEDPGPQGELTLKSLEALEQQVAALSRELSKSEEQVEMMRRHLATERQQVAHLMTILLRGEKRKRKRGLFARMLFWRKSEPASLELAPPSDASLHAKPPESDATPEATETREEPRSDS